MTVGPQNTTRNMTRRPILSSFVTVVVTVTGTTMMPVQQLRMY
jgi:hypothetical protein